MTKRVVATDDELERLLREDPQFAVEMIDADYRENIWRYIRSWCLYFDDDDVHDVYISTLRGFLACIKKPNFNPNEPLKLIFHIAKLRALSRRKAKKASRKRQLDELLDVVVTDMKDTRTRLDWLSMKTDWPEFRRVLERLIDELPDKQRDAMNAFVETYWEIRTEGSKRRLAEQIREQYGYDCTAAQAADNVRAAIKTLVPKLNRAGFNLLRRD